MKHFSKFALLSHFIIEIENPFRIKFGKNCNLNGGALGRKGDTVEFWIKCYMNEIE